MGSDKDTMREHYNFDYPKSTRGRVAGRLAQKSYPVMVMLNPKVVQVFDSPEAVNEALFALIELSKKAGGGEDTEKETSGTGRFADGEGLMGTCPGHYN